jgi:hypothetical protein
MQLVTTVFLCAEKQNPVCMSGVDTVTFAVIKTDSSDFCTKWRKLEYYEFLVFTWDYKIML